MQIKTGILTNQKKILFDLQKKTEYVSQYKTGK